MSEDFRRKLKEAYEELPVRSEEELEKLKPLLASFAELLSQRANRQVLLKVVGQLSQDAAGLRDEELCADRFFGQCQRILNFDTGSVFLLRGTGKNALLKPLVLRWGAGQPESCTFKLHSKEGLIPMIARNAIKAQEDPDLEPGILCATRSEMDEEAPPGFGDSREIRNIQSFLGVPIICENQVLGVLEIGTKRTNAFDNDDRQLLQAFADYLGASVRACREWSALMTILAQGDLRELLSDIVNYLPQFVNGTGCSVFLREESDSQSGVVLLSSTELPKLVDKATYKPGEGLTGWVLKTGRLLNIACGPDCRSEKKLKKIDPELRWLGKYMEKDESRVDYQNKAFLACPIRTASRSIIGVLRIGSRIVGNFPLEDERAIRSCSDAIGSVVERAGIENAVREIRAEIRTLRSSILAGQREILNAIGRSPHAFVMLASKVGFGVCLLSLALFYLFKLALIDPGVSLFGCFAFAIYWLMGKIGERIYLKDISAEPKSSEK